MEKFDQKGFPVLRLHDHFFEVKAIDFGDFKAFDYAEVEEITYAHSNDNWMVGGLLTMYLSKNDPYEVRILKKNGTDWIYEASPKYNPYFSAFIEKLNERCKNQNSPTQKIA